LAEIERVPEFEVFGRVAAIQSLLVEIAGVERHLTIGGRVTLQTRDNRTVDAEVVSFRAGRDLAMPFGPLEGVGMGCKAVIGEAQPAIRPDPSWLGRVVDARGRPIHGGPPLAPGAFSYPLRAAPPPAHLRKRVGPKIDLGVRALNTFTSCCLGQRMGIFAASGVGKSVLLSMIAKYTSADISVIGLIGERGREVQEFLHEDLGPEGLARSIVVVATSDEPALMRRQAAYLTLTLAEYFRDLERNVLCLMDSVTRFVMAQREIGLSGGEPPTTKGYPPTAFAELPKLLERAGPGTGKGSITGLFTVLVEGDDHNEPIADAVRGILDGHIVLERQIAERGRYPAVNVLRSISRTMPGCNTDAENAVVAKAKRYISTYDDMAELIRLGAYKRGSDPQVDEAIDHQPKLDDFLRQGKAEKATLAEGYGQLGAILGMADAVAPPAAAATGPVKQTARTIPKATAKAAAGGRK
jgi:flagellum-specific ATP synthase